MRVLKEKKKTNSVVKPQEPSRSARNREKKNSRTLRSVKRIIKLHVELSNNVFSPFYFHYSYYFSAVTFNTIPGGGSLESVRNATVTRQKHSATKSVVRIIKPNEFKVDRKNEKDGG